MTRASALDAFHLEPASSVFQPLTMIISQAKPAPAQLLQSIWRDFCTLQLQVWPVLRFSFGFPFSASVSSPPLFPLSFSLFLVSQKHPSPTAFLSVPYLAVCHFLHLSALCAHFQSLIMASWLGHATTTFTSAPETVSLPLKVNADSKDSSIALLDLIKSTTPPCRLNPLLFNAHLQTCWTALKGIDIPITYKRRVFESTSTVYPGSFAVDFVASTSNTPEAPDPDLPVRTTVYTATDFELLGSDDEKPMLILLHGLSGGSHEVYLRHVLRPLCLNVKEEDKWEACVVNSRGCAHSKITSGVLYNARSTWDMRQTVNWIKQKWPKRKLFGIGFSLGANILTNVCKVRGVRSILIQQIHSANMSLTGFCSTCVKKAQSASSMLQSWSPIRGISTSVTSTCKIACWASKYILG